jgi:hypothetical protein
MINKASSIEVTWAGPYGWPTFEGKNNLHPEALEEKYGMDGAMLESIGQNSKNESQ